MVLVEGFAASLSDLGSTGEGLELHVVRYALYSARTDLLVRQELLEEQVALVDARGPEAGA